MKQDKTITAEELDKKFDDGKEDITEYFDWEKAKFHHISKRINLDIPENILSQIDQEAKRIGIARTALMKVWLSERIDLERKSHSVK